MSNGYSTKMIDKLIQKKQNLAIRKQLYSVTPESDPFHCTGSLTYFGTITDKVADILNRNKIQVAFKTNNSIRRIFNAKQKRSLSKKSGVYKLNCDDCNGVYVGQTGRSFETRYKEHRAAFRNRRPERSHFAKHLLDSGHQIHDSHTYKILHTCEKGRQLNILEQLEIYKNRNNSNVTLLNDQIDLTHSPLIQTVAAWSSRGGGGSGGSGGSSSINACARGPPATCS